MRALTSLNISNNVLTRGAHKGYGNYATGTTGMHAVQLAPLSHNDIAGLVALADAIPGIGALIKLDISNTYIGAEQKGSLQRMCVASGIDLAM
jgi:hypothetical protein